MSETKTFQLIEIADGFNVSLDTIITFLSSKGRQVENDPNTKIGSTEYNILYEQFYGRKKWKDTDERFIVYLDIMGFKDFASRNKHEDVLARLQKVLDFTKDAEGYSNTGSTTDEKGNSIPFETIHITTFSDSIFLFSKDSTILSFGMITLAASSLFVNAIKEGIPMKGAMAYGQITVDRKQRIYCGQPLIDAHLLHEQVNYYGVVAHHSIDEYFINHEVDGYYKGSYIEVKTPLKSGNISHYNLNWFESLSILSVLRQGSPIVEFEEEIKKLKAITSGAPRKYIDNTVEVFNSMYPHKNTK